MIHKHVARFALIVLLTALPLQAAVTVGPLFGEHMVLQRGVEAPIWGKAAPGEKVTVKYAGKSAEATADDKGEWKAELAALAPGDASSLTITGDKTEKPIVLEDVAVGDVWICSGQSNMGFAVNRSNNAEQEIAAADFPNIRLFKVPNVTAVDPQRDLPGGQWKICSPKTVGDFSAAGYFFGRDIHKSENVPVGLIQNAWGGMPAESFTSAETLKSDPDFAKILERKAHPKPRAERPTTAPVPQNAPFFASNIYNSMVLPLAPYAIKGVIWYQGESNAGRAEQYRKLFPAMIADWRKTWNQGDFPFLFVQLANYGNKKPRPSDPADSNWAELREAQTLTLAKSPNTAMAVIIDVGESEDIHPKNKQDVGKRLALLAEKIAYGKKDVAAESPMYDTMKIEGSKIRVKFKNAEQLHAKDGAAPKGFQIAGEDQKWRWAEAKIENDEVVVWSGQVSEPKAVRYGWGDDPVVNLYNAADLPMCPFRTDDWKMITAGEK